MLALAIMAVKKWCVNFLQTPVFLVFWCILLQVKHGTSTISQDFTIEENKAVRTYIGKLHGVGPFLIFEAPHSPISDLDIDRSSGEIYTRIIFNEFFHQLIKH